MYFINIYNVETDKSWKEEFWDYGDFQKRYYRLKYSKKLIMTSRSLLEWEH